MSALEEIGQLLASAGERVGPAVVGIGHHWPQGSGVIIGPGRVLTNAHNLRGEATTIRFGNGRRAEGRLLGADVDADLAVLAAETGEVAPLPWPPAGRAIGIGEPVVALSNPSGDALRVTFGFVTGVARAFRGPRGRAIRGSLEHTAPLARGASGGPIVGVGGEFLGLNTNRLGEGFYLAIPADAELRARVDALGRGEAPERPRLGIAVAPAHVARRLRRSVGLPERDGILVRAVEEGSRAAQAGLREGDLVVAANDRPVGDPDALAAEIDRLAEGVELRLLVVRGTGERTVTVAAEA